ncbi:hypothetical protein GCM10017655_08160 [Pseudomonas turukhanskensis]|uniref:Uncharacterized protein n=1 Tax=Pseudomonas turukhanskensis TaxID=1806536 RepID=A0A9W6K587_9PSED|nr:hypothetical protein GCM10017655_08160 [Pseudomonas turukhanskensis]
MEAFSFVLKNIRIEAEASPAGGIRFGRRGLSLELLTFMHARHLTFQSSFDGKAPISKFLSRLQPNGPGGPLLAGFHAVMAPAEDQELTWTQTPDFTRAGPGYLIWWPWG